MHILHIVRQFHPLIGGLENYVYNLAINQISQGHSITVLTYNRDFMTNKKLPSLQVDSSGIKIIRIPYFFSKRYPVNLNILKYLRNHDVLNVHAVDFFADYIALTKFIHKKRTVLITHGGYFHTSWALLFKKLYFKSITRFILRYYDVVIGCSEKDIETFSKITSKIIQINNGVDIHPYIRTPKKYTRDLLVFVGRIDHNKRVDRLIKIVRTIHGKGRKVKLIIAGPDWRNLRSELELLAMNLNISQYVIFKGPLDNEELMRLYSKAFLFVSASEYEGFGISAVEAMASGTVCALNNIKSYETFLHNKTFGILCDFENAEETSDKIIKLLDITDEIYHKASLDAREFSKNYSWDKVIKRFNSIYEEFNK